jgi:hypothetical protein
MVLMLLLNQTLCHGEGFASLYSDLRVGAFLLDLPG